MCAPCSRRSGLEPLADAGGGRIGGVAWLALTLALVWFPQPAGADGTRASRPLVDRPNFELRTGVYARTAADPVHRTVFAQKLTMMADPFGEQVSLGAGLGWVTLFQRDTGGAWSTTSVPGNLFLAGWNAFELPAAWRLFVELGVTVVLGLAGRTEPNPPVHVALNYGVAMQAAWDSWLFAEGRAGAVFPVRAVRSLDLWAIPSQIELDSAFVVMLPRRSAGEDSSKKMLQVSVGYRLWPTDRIFAAARAHLVWLPSAPLFREQSAAGVLVGITWGRWRFGVEGLANIDEPYGWTGQGEGIWSVHTEIGVKL